MLCDSQNGKMPRRSRSGRRTPRSRPFRRRTPSRRRRHSRRTYRSTLVKLINGPGPLHVCSTQKGTQSNFFIKGYEHVFKEKSINVRQISAVLHSLNEHFSHIPLDPELSTNASNFPTSEPSRLLAMSVGVQEQPSSTTDLKRMRTKLSHILSKGAFVPNSLYYCARMIGMDLIKNHDRWGLEDSEFLPAYAIVVCLASAMKNKGENDTFDMSASVTQHVSYMSEQLKREASVEMTVQDLSMETCQKWDVAMEKIVKRSWLDYRMQPDKWNVGKELLDEKSLLKTFFLENDKDALKKAKTKHEENALKTLSLRIATCIHREAVLRAAWECVLRSLFRFPHNAGLSKSTQTNLIACLVPYMDPHEMPKKEADLSNYPPVDRYAIEWWRHQYPTLNGSSATEEDVRKMNEAVEGFKQETIRTSRKTFSEAFLNDLLQLFEPQDEKKGRQSFVTVQPDLHQGNEDGANVSLETSTKRRNASCVCCLVQGPYSYLVAIKWCAQNVMKSCVNGILATLAPCAAQRLSQDHSTCFILSRRASFVLRERER